VCIFVCMGVLRFFVALIYAIIITNEFGNEWQIFRLLTNLIILKKSEIYFDDRRSQRASLTSRPNPPNILSI